MKKYIKCFISTILSYYVFKYLKFKGFVKEFYDFKELFDKECELYDEKSKENN